MGPFAWREQVAALSGVVDTLEAQVARGDRSTAELEEFKSGLDDLRLRAWSLLTAASSDDPHGFQERFRTRRGIDFCRALNSDLQTGKLSARVPDLPDLAAAARGLAAAVKKATQKPQKRRGKGAV
jgi:hypothetical protein